MAQIPEAHTDTQTQYKHNQMIYLQIIYKAESERDKSELTE